MSTVKEEIAKNLLFYRKRAKLTQQKLADELGVKNNTISQWESGANAIDVEVLFNICKILNVGIDDMFGEYAIGGDRFNQREKELLFAYRDNPDMQQAVDRLLKVETENNNTIEDGAPVDDESDELYYRFRNHAAIKPIMDELEKEEGNEKGREAHK